MTLIIPMSLPALPIVTQLPLPPEPEVVDFAWFVAAMLIGTMGIYVAALNRADRADCPDIIPLFYVSIAGLLLLNLNKSAWFQENIIDVIIEVLLIGVIVVGAGYVFYEQLQQYGLRTPRESAADLIARLRSSTAAADDESANASTAPTDTGSDSETGPSEGE